MKSQRSILAVRYTPISVAGGVRKAVGGFLRYVQYRDQHLALDDARGVDAYVRYVAHRDRTSPRGRIFGAEGGLTDLDRRRFVDFVARSTRGLEPKWVLGKDGTKQDRQRAVYTFILSPEDSRGLDLRRMAKAAMHQLEADAGPAGLGPWFAAEHRNTRHHHVHIVLAARREVAPGRYATLLVTRERLQHMKEAIAIEMQRQRGLERDAPVIRLRSKSHSAFLTTRLHPPAQSLGRFHWLTHAPATPHRPVSNGRRQHSRPIAATVLRLRTLARRYHQHMEQELERESIRAEFEGWVR
jgi:hypothetical protein